MHINRVISYASGWQRLQEEGFEEFLNIERIIAVLESELVDAVTPRAVPDYGHHRQGVDASLLQRVGDVLLETEGWTNHRVRARSRDGLGVYIRRWKNGVGAKFMAAEGLGSTFASWVMVDVPRARDLGACYLSVLIVPLHEVKGILERRPLFSFERCLAQLEDLLPLRHAAPFVILGVSHVAWDRHFIEFELPVEEEAPHQREYGDFVEKSIEFPQEYYQAGVSILSYFGEVLKQRHPDVHAKVRIEQDGLTVRMHIESATGDKEIIEKTLEEYGLVLAEEMPPEALFDSKLQILALEQKLELAKVEVRHTQQLLALAESSYSERIRDLQDAVQHLRTYLGRQLMQSDAVHGLLTRQCETNEKLLLAHMSQADALIQDLIRQAGDNRALFDALSLIERKLGQGAMPQDEDAVREALDVIQREKPTMITQLKSHALNLSYEVSGSYLFKWIEAFAATV